MTAKDVCSVAPCLVKSTSASGRMMPQSSPSREVSGKRNDCRQCPASAATVNRKISVTTPSLGYQEDTSMSMFEIARLQIEEAITLFINKKFLCALTLAGAGEEISSRLMNSRGKRSSTEQSADAVIALKKSTGLAALEEVTNTSLYKGWNSARNTAKHHKVGEDETVVLNLFDEAYWMIRRALENTKSLSLQISNEVAFQNWVNVNINMGADEDEI